MLQVESPAASRAAPTGLVGFGRRTCSASKAYRGMRFCHIRVLRQVLEPHLEAPISIPWPIRDMLYAEGRWSSVESRMYPTLHDCDTVRYIISCTSRCTTLGRCGACSLWVMGRSWASVNGLASKRSMPSRWVAAKSSSEMVRASVGSRES